MHRSVAGSKLRFSVAHASGEVRLLSSHFAPSSDAPSRLEPLLAVLGGAIAPRPALGRSRPNAATRSSPNPNHRVLSRKSEKVNRAWMEKVEKLAETAELEKQQIHENGQKLLYAREMERIKHFREMEGEYKQALVDLGDQYSKKAEWDRKKLKETENELEKIDGEVQRYVEMCMKKDVE